MTVQALAFRNRTRVFEVLASGLAAVTPRAVLVGIAALAAVLRFDGLGAMPVNPYYDAAVRSMGSSWHAFLVGAFNPNASVAIDKPPVDVWLQVASTKLFGFTHFALLLPEALASVVAVVLLYDIVRRGFGRTAGLAAAAALAVLPIQVITARSDTMDGAMMAMLVLAAWLVVRAVERNRARELYLAAAVVGLAFETKLFEALVPLPALALLFLLGSRAPWVRRIEQLVVAGVVTVGVALAWPIYFGLMPAADRPYPMGSTNGSIWNTIFVYNGTGRLNSTSTRMKIDHLNPPGPTRLLSHGPLHLDTLIGVTLFAAIAFAIVAVVVGVARRRSVGKLPLAIGVAMGTWLVVAGALLSHMWHMPLRYLEPLDPAIAAVLGIGVALGAGAAVRAALRHGLTTPAGIATPLAVLVPTGASLTYASASHALPPAAIIGLVGAAAVLLVAVVGRRTAARVTGPLTGLVAAFVLVAVLAVPTVQSFSLVRARTADGGALGAMPAPTVAHLSAYLTRHRRHRRYEFASLNAALAGPLIVADGQPVLILAGWPPRTLVPARGLKRAVRAGEVKYVLLSATGSRHRRHAAKRADHRLGQAPRSGRQPPGRAAPLRHPLPRLREVGGERCTCSPSGCASPPSASLTRCSARPSSRRSSTSVFLTCSARLWRSRWARSTATRSIAAGPSGRAGRARRSLRALSACRPLASGRTSRCWPASSRRPASTTSSPRCSPSRLPPSSRSPSADSGRSGLRPAGRQSKPAEEAPDGLGGVDSGGVVRRARLPLPRRGPVAARPAVVGARQLEMLDDAAARAVVPGLVCDTGPRRRQLRAAPTAV
jgi:4-amino-4-deoxy-L-arabinose transferase-like glycosyltransferase